MSGDSDDQGENGFSHDGEGIFSPDHAEEVMAPLLDNVVPSFGYHTMPVVGLGGSAGSIRELQKFFRAVSPNTGMAFIVVLHLSPQHESSLAQILQQTTEMAVVQVTEDTPLKVNSVYVIPPAKHLTMTNGHLIVADMTQARGKRMAVDLLFRTLADTHGPHATAIVLSGADSDGTIGIKRIKERGGLTIVQDPSEAEFSSMPQSSIQTGMVDWVLPVDEMVGRLLAYRSAEKSIQLPPEDGPSLTRGVATSPASTATNDELLLREILTFLRMRTGREFVYYKRATVVRRIGRRMQVNGLNDLAGYLAFMRTNPGEAGALLKDLLISVTNFFRDAEAFHALEKVIGELFVGKSTGDTVRVWVTACATGEEAYSVLMLLCEYAATMSSPPAIQVFATDLDEDAINVGREGVYPSSISADVSEERLREFFNKEHGGYRIKRSVREMVLFATHDLLKDSPFSRVDLVSSRNLLIYLNKEAQLKAFDIFHFALKPGGKLFLGASESVVEGSTLFAAIDKKQRLYLRRDVPARTLPVQHGQSTLAHALAAHQKAVSGVGYTYGGTSQAHVLVPTLDELAGDKGAEPSWPELHLKLMERFGPPSVIVNAAHEIVHLSEHAGRYLHYVGGVPTMDLLRLVQPSLRVELRAALFRAAQSAGNVEVRGLLADDGENKEIVDLFITHVHERFPGYLMVVFKSRPGNKSEPQRLDAQEPVVHQLEQELMQVKGDLRATVEQYAASIEELKAANEELQAMNEELRSATEEMETGREELQSINEELTTVNQEAKSKVDELGRANSDLQNLMASTAIATVFLDRELRIKRYTPNAVALFNIIPTDVGRPLAHLAHRLVYPDIINDADRVLIHLGIVEREVINEVNECFLARILPYRTTDEKIAGVVLTFLDITARKNAETELMLALEENKRARLAAESAAKAKDHFMSVLSHELRTPLTPIILSLSDLIGTPGLDGDVAETLKMISRNVNLEAMLIDQLLDYTRMSKGKADFEEALFDTHQVIREAVEITASNFKDKNQQVQVQLAAEMSKIKGDAMRLQQAIWNLLKNASKFTPLGGRVEVSTVNQDGVLLVHITDSGIGIPRKNLESIFNAFEQGDTGVTKQFGGLGLGLTIAKAAVEAHSGQIAVSSDGEGTGATFTITLPVSALS